MTDSIQKLYKIAGVGKEPQYIPGVGEIIGYGNYPQFTPEKQLELIKWLLHNQQTTQVELRYFGNSYYVTHCTKIKNKNYEYVRDGKARLFDNSIAGLFCDMWQDLTAKQKQEIKEILQ